jgi:chaperonin cofactor prefoldin
VSVVQQVDERLERLAAEMSQRLERQLRPVAESVGELEERLGQVSTQVHTRYYWNHNRK